MIKRVICFLLLTGCGGAFAATFTVGTLFDNDFSDDANPGDGVCADESPLGTCTLRAAIQEANALAGSDTIEFSVAGTISPDTSDRGAMPEITGPLTIDGSTAPGWVPGGAPAIYLDGRIISASAQPFASGLVVDPGPFLTVGLGIIGFPWAGIEFQPGSLGGLIQGCWIGLDANGDAQPHPASTSSRGVLLEGDDAIIGLMGTPGNFSGLGNVIGGHELEGIRILGDDNTVLGNVIGMTADGMTARGNEDWGIFLSDTADGNRIGDGDGTDNAGNAIANNTLGGIVVDGTNNVVDANTFGFKAGSGVFFQTSTNAIEVAGDGHVIGGAVGNQIINHVLSVGILLGRTLAGDDTPATNVTVESNDIGTVSSIGVAAGIRIALAGSNSNTIRGNRIAGQPVGTGIEIAADGNLVTENRLGIDTELAVGGAPGNFAGILIASANNDVTFNEIGNHIDYGIGIDGASNEIFANDIGFAAGLGDVGNAEAGIRLLPDAVDNLIQGNRVLNNGGPGVEFALNASIVGNTVLGNSIEDNDGIGIDFTEFELGIGEVRGPTENDPGDPDGGANRRMNHPEFGEAVPIPGTDPLQTIVTFEVDSDPANQAYPITVDFYRANGYGARDAFSFISATIYDTFGVQETVTLTLPAGVGIDRHFTALATDADGNTSEFAPARSLGEVVFRNSYED